MIFYLPAILFGLFSVHASEIQETVKQINDLLPPDQQYPDLLTFFSDQKSWDSLKKIQHVANAKVLFDVMNQIYEACLNTFDLDDSSKLITEEFKALTKDYYCESLSDEKFNPNNERASINFKEYAEEIANHFKLLSAAYSKSGQELKENYITIQSPTQFADAIVKVLKDNVGGVKLTEDQEVITKLKAACEVKSKPDGGKDKTDDGKNKPDDGKNPEDPSLGNKDKPWTMAEKVGAGIGIGAVVIIPLIIIALIVKRKN
jgi:hypothetical protein